MVDPREKYREALAAFAAPGGRWANKGALTYWGKAAGFSADEIIADARAAGVANRDVDIRRGWEDARPKGEAVRGAYVTRAKPKPQPPKYKNLVRNMVENVDRCEMDAICDLSPCRDFVGQDERAQTSLFLEAAFSPNELLHVFKNGVPTIGKPRVNIRPAADWVQTVKRGGALLGDIIVANPFSGKQGETSTGKKSYIAQSCLVSFPFMVLEMDDMTLDRQCAFWVSFIRSSPLSPALVSLTFSGNRSIHALLHVGCGSLTEWQGVRERIRALFASDPDAAFRLDDQAMRPRTGTRIPGVKRFDNGVTQRLLYLNPRARSGTMWKDAHAEPPAAPEAPPPPPPPPATEPQTATAYRWTCDSCGCAARCREVWGRYWAEKSSGGRGCDAPVKVA